MTYNDITLRQYLKVKNLDTDDVEDQIRATEILLNINADNLTIQEWAEKVKELDFLAEPIPKTIIRFSYNINNRVYDCRPRLDNLSVSQYMDYVNLAKDQDHPERILAVILIPEGKKYAEGYDINQVYEDILDIPVIDFFSILDFFILQFKVCIKTLEEYSMDLMRTGTLSRKDKKDLMTVQKAMQLVITDCYSLLEQ